MAKEAGWSKRQAAKTGQQVSLSEKATTEEKNKKLVLNVDDIHQNNDFSLE